MDSLRDFHYTDPLVLQLGTGVLQAWIEGGKDKAEQYLWDVTAVLSKDASQAWMAAGIIYLLMAGGLPFVGSSRIRKRFGTSILRYSRFLKRRGDRILLKYLTKLEIEMILVDMARYGGRYWGVKIPDVERRLIPVLGTEIVRLMNLASLVREERVTIPKQESEKSADHK